MLKKKYNKSKMKLRILLGVENAMKEVRLIQGKKKEGKLLKNFLDELKNPD